MTRRRNRGTYKQEPPHQFRPGIDLDPLIAAFASEHGLVVNEACKVLVALAVTEMDRRFYGLMLQLAEAMGGVNPFPRACAHIHTSLQAARRATDRLLQSDPERALFILSTVRDFLATMGRTIQGESYCFLPPGSQREELADVPPDQGHESRPKERKQPQRAKAKGAASTSRRARKAAEALETYQSLLLEREQQMAEGQTEEEEPKRADPEQREPQSQS
jgi:hypothetical protein